MYDQFSGVVLHGRRISTSPVACAIGLHWMSCVLLRVALGSADTGVPQGCREPIKATESPTSSVEATIVRFKPDLGMAHVKPNPKR